MKNETKSRNSQFRFSVIEPEAYPKLIKAVHDILCEGSSHNSSVFDKNRWSWQYENLPSKDSKIYGVFDKEKIIGYYHIPIYFGKVNSVNVNFGVVQDVAISKSARGAGLFKQLAEFAHNDILRSNVDLLYTFPNNKSIHNFLKYNNYKLVRTLPSYIYFLDPEKIIKHKINKLGIPFILGKTIKFFLSVFSRKNNPGHTFNQYSQLNEEIIELFGRNETSYTCGLTKDFNYLNWRHFTKPNTSSTIITIHHQNKLQAGLIIKSDVVNNKPTLFIVDFAYQSDKEKYLMSLIDEIKRNTLKYFKNEPQLLFVSGNDKVLKKIWRSGFIKIPKKLNPRPLNMLVRTFNKSLDNYVFDHNNWKISLSDWDVL